MARPAGLPGMPFIPHPQSPLPTDWVLATPDKGGSAHRGDVGEGGVRSPEGSPPQRPCHGVANGVREVVHFLETGEMGTGTDTPLGRAGTDTPLACLVRERSGILKQTEHVHSTRGGRGAAEA